jgi:hypothetical protein
MEKTRHRIFVVEKTFQLNKSPQKPPCPFMTTPSLRNPVPASQASPSALTFPSRRLLTEKSSVAAEFRSTNTKTDTVKIRITLMTQVLNENSGYRHYGINE